MKEPREIYRNTGKREEYIIGEEGKCRPRARVFRAARVDHIYSSQIGCKYKYN